MACKPMCSQPILGDVGLLAPVCIVHSKSSN